MKAFLIFSSIFILTSFSQAKSNKDLTNLSHKQYVEISCQTMANQKLIISYSGLIKEATVNGQRAEIQLSGGSHQSFSMRINGILFKGDLVNQKIIQNNRTDTDHKELQCRFEIKTLQDL